MSNDYFEFKKFTVRHDLCAMKVGTDGVLLGAWAKGGQNILDAGTGSGLIALCMAQRYRNAKVTAIDIDEGACRQAEVNAVNSAFAERIEVHHTALQRLGNEKFDAIVCNPPFFKNSLECPDPRRAMARHASALPAKELFVHSARLLADEGELSVVIPASLRGEFDSEALFAGLFPSRVVMLKTVERKPVSRCLLAYRHHPVNKVEEVSACLGDCMGGRSEWYAELTKDFYK